MSGLYPEWNLAFEGQLISQLITKHNPGLREIRPQVRPPQSDDERQRLGDYFVTVAGLDVFIFESTALGVDLVKDPALQILQTRQIGDDGAHAEIMRRRVEHLTGRDPIRQIKERAEQQWKIVGDIPRRGLLGFLAFEIEYELNIVPDIATFEFEFRVLSVDKSDTLAKEVIDYAKNVLEPEMKAVAPEAGFEFEDRSEFAGLDTSPDAEVTLFAKHLSGRNRHSKVAYGTEGGLFALAGIPTVVCGPGSIDQAHKADEFIAVSELDKCGKFLDRLIEHCAR